MSIARVTEIKVSSKKSFDDAIKVGIARVHETIRNVRSAWIQHQEVMVDDKGQITEYRVRMQVTFMLDELSEK